MPPFGKLNLPVGNLGTLGAVERGGEKFQIVNPIVQLGAHALGNDVVHGGDVIQ